MIHPTALPSLDAPRRSIRRCSSWPLRLFLAGDSTVCDQDMQSNSRGWGQYLPEALGEGVQVINRAKSGASTKTFRKEGLWEELLKAKPDWVLIQFGHNDSHAPVQPESTRANGDYADNLRRFIADLRAISSQAVFVTPVRRFQFDESGQLWEGTSALEPYARAMREVGRELQVPIVDLFASSTHFFQHLGPDSSSQLSAVPGQDFTHFNEAGARAIAGLVVRDLAVAAPLLWEALTVPRAQSNA